MDSTTSAAVPAADVPRDGRYFLVGGGIASLAAALFLIRDGRVPGHAITILEQSDRLGGSLDGAGIAEAGYVARGGRMLESKYLCTFGLFDSVPTLDGTRTITQEIMAWNKMMPTDSRSRLVRDGRAVNEPSFGLSEHHIATIARLVAEPEHLLGRTSIAEQFDPAFFATDFWLMWCTTFAFQPWHSAVELKRYLARFAHMVSGFNRLSGILRTVYNQYDSMVRPLHKYLLEHGVVFELGTCVTNLGVHTQVGINRVLEILALREGRAHTIAVDKDDRVIVTLGSMTDAASLGGMDRPPAKAGTWPATAWLLWESLAANRPEFGRPGNFDSHVAKSKWVSFTTTLRTPELFGIIGRLSGNVPGEGGLITFPNSPWLASIVVPHQPHFIGQPADVQVLWGYGLLVERPGQFVKKPMQDCTGREIMTEILGHLGVAPQAEALLETATCIPCMMPFITSQFLCRERGDRPQIRPEGWSNLAFVGQFCELADDVVFTVEYSVRSAQEAVYSLLAIDRQPPKVYKGQHDPRVHYHAFKALHDIGA